jgi:replicative DNA helicase
MTAPNTELNTSPEPISDATLVAGIAQRYYSSPNPLKRQFAHLGKADGGVTLTLRRWNRGLDDLIGEVVSTLIHQYGVTPDALAAPAWLDRIATAVGAHAHGVAANQGIEIVFLEAIARARASAKKRLTSVGSEDGTVTVSRTLQQIVESEEFLTPSPPIPTSLEGLNKLIGGGHRRRNVGVVIAPPAGAKTALAVREMLFHGKAGRPCLFVSAEIDDVELAARAVSHEFGEPMTAVLDGRVPAAVAQKLVAGIELHVMEIDPGRDQLANIEARAQEIEAEIVLVDFLQLLAITNEDGQRQAVGQLVYAFKAMARRLNIAIVLLSSTSRVFYSPKRKDADGNEREVPSDWLAAAKDAGEIESAAAWIIYLEKGADNAATNDTDLRMIIPKARHGRTGFVGLRFRGAVGQFFEDASVLSRMGKAEIEATQQKDLREILLGLLAESPLSKEDLRRGNVAGLKVRGVAAVDMLMQLVAEGLVIGKKVRIRQRNGIPKQTYRFVLADGSTPATDGRPFAGMGKSAIDPTMFAKILPFTSKDEERTDA